MRECADKVDVVMLMVLFAGLAGVGATAALFFFFGGAIGDFIAECCWAYLNWWNGGIYVVNAAPC